MIFVFSSVVLHFVVFRQSLLLNLKQISWLDWLDSWDPEILLFPNPSIGIMFQFTPHISLPSSSLLFLVLPLKFDSSAFRGLFPFIFKIHLFLLSLCVCMCYTCILGTLRSPGTGTVIWKLRGEPASFERGTSALNYRVISPGPNMGLYNSKQLTQPTRISFVLLL